MDPKAGTSITGITEDGMEPHEKAPNDPQVKEGNTAAKSLEALTVSNSTEQMFTSSQTAVPTLAVNEEGKGQSNEMVFTVVAVNTNNESNVSVGDIIQSSLNNVTLPKGLQLSLVPTGTENMTSTINTSDIQLSTGHSSTAFNQLALIASTVSSPQDDERQKFLSQATSGQEGESQRLLSQSSSQQQYESRQILNQNKDTLAEMTGSMSSTDHLKQSAELNKIVEKESENAKRPRVNCPVCQQDFSDLPSMRRHRLIHSDNKPFQCEFCEKAFRRKDNLREHRNIHTQEHVYSCNRCGKTFPRKYTHKVHMARFCKPNTGTTSSDLPWDQSDPSQKSSRETLTLKGCKSLVNSKISDPCPVCLKTFRDSSTLKRHLLTHSDDRPFKCEECNKSFRRKDHLQEHVIVHKEVRPFGCQQCGKTFSRKNGLKTHMIRTSHLPQGVSLSNLTIEKLNGPEDPQNDELVTNQDTPNAFHLMLESDNRQALQQSSENVVQTSKTASIQGSSQMTDTEFTGAVDSENSSRNPGNMVSTLDGTKETPTSEDLSGENTSSNIGGNNGSTSGNEGTSFGEINASSDITRKFSLGKEKPDSHNDSFSHVNETDATKNNDGTHQCPICPEMFQGREELWRHFQGHLTADVFACEHCLAAYTAPELFEEHRLKCGGRITGDMKDNQDTQLPTDATTQVGEITSAATHLQKSVEDTLDKKEETEQEGSSQVPALVKSAEVSGRSDRICSICNKQFRDANALRRHSLVHSGERPYSCEQCGKRFRRRDHLKSHVTSYHCGTTTYHCKNCQAVFNTRYTLSVHSKSCKKVPNRPQTVIVDAVKLAEIPESKCCPICNKSFKDPSTQRRHLRIHSEERPYQCELCPKSFRRKDNLKEHMLCHSAQKPFTCKDCGKALSRRSSLTNHRNICRMRRLESTPPMTTTIPETRFTEPPSEPPTMCIDDQPKASDQCTDDDQAENHEMCVNNENRCSSQALGLCISGDNETSPGASDIGGSGENDLTSPNISNCRTDTLEEHMEVLGDDGEKGFACDECGKVFRAKWTLKYHQRVHTGEKPYTCLTCDRQFRQPSHLKIHQRTHSGERPYVCEDCGRGFIDSSTMRRHARLHKDTVDRDEVIDQSTGSEKTSVDQTEGMAVGGQCIQLAVSSANETASSTQPISTNVVPDINISGEESLVQVEGALSSDDSSHVGNITLSSKMAAISDINWQQNETQQGVEQVTYYLVPAEKDSAKEPCNEAYQNISF